MSRDVPSGWRKATLADVLALLRNGFSCRQNEGSGSTPVTRIETISNGSVDLGRVGLTDWDDRLSDYRLIPGDILFSHINSPAHIGKTALYTGDGDLYHGMNLMLLRRDPAKIDATFLLEVLRTEEARTFFRSSCRPAVNQASLSKGIISGYEFVLPPLPEQRRIAEILSSVDEAIQATEAVIEQTRKVKDGVLERLLTKGIGHTEFKDTEIGIQPAAWSVSTFGELLDFKGGTQPPKSTFIYAPAPGYIRLLQIRDFESDDKPAYIEERIKSSRCSENDILIARYGASLGRILRGKAGAYNVALVKVLFRGDRLDRDFTYHWLGSSHFQNHLRSVGNRSAQDGFNKEDLSPLLMAVPPLEEQRMIAHIISRFDQMLVENHRTLSGLKSTKSALMSDLLTGRKRVTDAMALAAE